MSRVDELKDNFSKLTDEEKLAFMKSLMPAFRELFTRNPQKMMAEMMPVCQEIMKSCTMDMQGMMNMMSGVMGGSKR